MWSANILTLSILHKFFVYVGGWRCLFERHIFAKWVRFLQVLQIRLYTVQLLQKCEYEQNLHCYFFLFWKWEFCPLWERVSSGLSSPTGSCFFFFHFLWNLLPWALFVGIPTCCLVASAVGPVFIAISSVKSIFSWWRLMRLPLNSFNSHSWLSVLVCLQSPRIFLPRLVEKWEICTVLVLIFFKECSYETTHTAGLVWFGGPIVV